MLPMLVYIFFIGLFLLIALYYDAKSREVCLDVPGPHTLPFIGNAHQCIGGTPADVFEQIYFCWEGWKPRFKIYIGPQLILFLSDPKDVEVVLSNQEFHEKSLEYTYLQPWLGSGLLTSKGEKWRKHRKIITPTFHFKILENFLQIFNTQTDILAEKLKAIAKSEQFVNIFPVITLYALDTIAESAMGVSVNAQKDVDSDYTKAIKVLCEIFQERMKNPFKRLDFMFKLSRDYWKQKKALKLLHNYTNDMIQNRRKYLEMNKETFESYIAEDCENVYGKKKKLAFLDMLLLSKKDGRPLTNIEIREEVDTFLFEGHDTTTSALSFLLHCLSNNRTVQKKVYEEQLEIFGDDIKTATPTYTDLQNMKYLEMVIKEGLRLFPSVPLLGRVARQKTVINDLEVPANATIVLCVYHMHRDPNIFPNPDEFIPERFSPEESAKRNPFSYIAFSAGQRNCIGQKFAMMEMKIAVSKIVRLFEILTSRQDPILRCDIILRGDNGVYMKFKERK